MPLLGNLPPGRNRRAAAEQSTTELVEALELARDRSDDAGKIEELERVIAHADAAGEARLGFDARADLMAVYNVLGERWRMLPALNWCRTTLREQPEVFTQRDEELLQRYQLWILRAVCGTSRLGLAQARAQLDELQELGRGLRAVYRLRCEFADHVGDEPAARNWFRQWQATPRDDESGCPGCERTRRVELLAGWGEWAQAVRVFEQVDDDRVFCVEQPEAALAAVLVPLLRLGRFDEAAQAHVRAYQRHRDERDALRFLPEHLRFCALTGHYQRGLGILTTHLHRLEQPYDETSAMRFATAGALLCRQAVEAGLDGSDAGPGGPSPVPEGGRRPSAEILAPLGAELLRTAQELAGRFDARNGTGHQSGRLAAWLAERPLCAPPPLPPEQEINEAGAGAGLAEGGSSPA